jgi:protein phosphatase
MNQAFSRLNVAAFGISDVGRVRTNNEDSYLFTQIGSGLINAVSPDGSDGGNQWVFIVADGMGGGQAGEVASRWAVDGVVQRFADQLAARQQLTPETFSKALSDAVEETNLSLFTESQRNQDLAGMGTTLTAAAVFDGTLTVAQLGDSRAYLVRDGSITQLTKDQSLVAQMVAAGKLTAQEAKTHPRRNVILQAMGIQSQIDVGISTAKLRSNDRLVVCSDGLWGKVEPEEIVEFVHRFEPQAACESLVRLANERGGEDNVTVIVANFTRDGFSDTGETKVPTLEIPKQKRSWWPFWLRRR